MVLDVGYQGSIPNEFQRSPRDVDLGQVKFTIVLVSLSTYIINTLLRRYPSLRINNTNITPALYINNKVRINNIL